MSDKFNYKYSAPTMEEKKEIESIRNQYLPKNEYTSKLEELRKLDSRVKNIPIITSLTIGVIGTLLFGTSMTFFLEWTDYFYFGIPLFLIGLIIALLAYPIHVSLTKKLKEKYSLRIIELSEELINSNRDLTN